MSDKNQQDQQRQREEQQRRQHEQDEQRRQREHEEEQRRQHEEQQRQQGEDGARPGQPGTRQGNPAQPYAETVVPEKRPTADAFLRPGAQMTHPSGYPKLKYHPVHGGVEVKDPGEESNLYPPTDWFDTPELADLARTHTEAEAVRFNNQIAKLKELEEKKLPVVRNSVQADEAIRNAAPEPL